MQGWMECVPNVSEGRDLALIAEMEARLRETPGVVVLDRDSDADHNRTVFTFVGPGDAVGRAAHGLIRLGIERIDLNHHEGAHPRMGAVDVVPFVPLGSTPMVDCVEAARRLAVRVASRWNLPVFLYENAQDDPRRRSLAAIRSGGFESHRRTGFAVGKADFGPSTPHPTAGSVAIGARASLIALKVILDCDDLDGARTLARRIGETSPGGVPAVRAMAIAPKSHGEVQVVIHLLDFRRTPLTRLRRRVLEEASRLELPVGESELVGLIPRAALAGAVEDLLELAPEGGAVGDLSGRVLEERLEGSGALEFASRLASTYPVPGGGAAAARTGAHAASLVLKVVRISAARAEAADLTRRLNACGEGASSRLRRFNELEQEDQMAFLGLLAAMRLSRRTAEEAAIRDRAIVEAAGDAMEAPFQILGETLELLPLVRDLANLASEGKLRAEADLGVALDLTRAAFDAAGWNVRANLPLVKDAGARENHLARQRELEARFGALHGEIRRQLLGVLK